VAALRGTLGASENRLTAADNVINTQTTNLTSAEDNISSADISQQVSNMSEDQVLTQTGISALSQANQMQQMLLKLFQ
jgi:flagellin